jgi:hypothetical protein
VGGREAPTHQGRWVQRQCPFFLFLFLLLLLLLLLL